MEAHLSISPANKTVIGEKQCCVENAPEVNSLNRFLMDQNQPNLSSFLAILIVRK